MLLVSISGVYAEDIDVESSVVTQSPISADVDASLSSCDAFNNDLSNIYEPSDSSDSYESSDSYGCYESLDIPQIDEEIGCAQDYSYGYFEPCDIAVIDADYNYIDSCYCESVDVPVVGVNCEYAGLCGHEEDIEGSTDVDVDCVKADCGTLKMPAVGEYGDINSIIEIIDDNVVLNNYNSYFDNIDIPVLAFPCLSQCDGIDKRDVSTIISEVTDDLETSESYKLIGHATQTDNLPEFESVDAILTIDASGMASGEAGEPVFDGILRTSEYISDVAEVYFGTLSEEDNEKFLRSVGSETLLFASIADWHNSVAFDELQNLAKHGQIGEDILDGCTVTKALLQYYPLTGELYIYKLAGDSEDEHSHVINDTNSHGLDYAYAKHVNVVFKDMPNLMVLTTYGIVFIEEDHTAGNWDGLNDILSDGISSETLLPDHKAIWTPLLLLSQQNLQKSFVNSHADDNGKIKKASTANKADRNDTNGSNSSNRSHHGGGHHRHYRHWGYNWGGSCCCHQAIADVVPDITLDSLNNSTNSTKNSTKNETNSTNATSTSGKRKTIESPKEDVKAKPTYTLVYAIIGIALVSILFNSSYMKRDD